MRYIYKIDTQKIQDGNFSLAIKCEGLFKSVKLFEDHIESVHQRTFEMDIHCHLIAQHTSNGASGKVINDLRVFPNFPKNLIFKIFSSDVTNISNIFMIETSSNMDKDHPWNLGLVKDDDDDTLISMAWPTAKFTARCQ